jgi:RNA polymerase sigma-70 factor, ECF subfamily
MAMAVPQEAGVSELYEELRPLMFSIAYRMLGSASDAEDIVQEAFLRFHRESGKGTAIDSPKAYLSAVTTRLAIDHLRSARVRRERYIGTWLPEPVLTDSGSDVTQHAETADSLSMAFLVLLESLTPVERAVFLLREVFDYGYDEIATVVGKSEENCRQIAVRARRQVEAKKPRFEASRKRREELARRFLRSGDQWRCDGPPRSALRGRGRVRGWGR